MIIPVGKAGSVQELVRAVKKEEKLSLDVYTKVRAH